MYLPSLSLRQACKPAVGEAAVVSFLLLLMHFFPPLKQLPLTSPELAQPENGSVGKGLLYASCAVVIWGWIPLDFVGVWLLVLSCLQLCFFVVSSCGSFLSPAVVLSPLQLWLSSLRLPGCEHGR